MHEAATGFLPRHGEAGLQTLLSCGGLHKPKACCTKNFNGVSWRARRVRKIAQGPKDPTLVPASSTRPKQRPPPWHAYEETNVDVMSVS